MERTLNLGILAHVDAGKTSLTERLLHTAGVIGEIGSVDAGSTQTDTLDLERQRGITIKSAVVSFVVGNVTVNLIDTPGHPDFIAEVERVLGVLDGAILVVSAVEGVQAQTRVLMRVLQRMRLPTLLFVNKIDRAGSRYDTLLSEIADRLTPAIAPMGTVGGLGGRDAGFTPHEPPLEVLAEHDDTLLAAYVNGTPPGDLRRALASHTRKALVYPVYFGSAITGAGIDELIGGITEILPAAAGDPAAEPSGVVFKMERGTAYVRMFAGAIGVRERLPWGTVTGIEVFERGGLVRRASVTAGQIAKITGLRGVRIGDTIGASPVLMGRSFAPPTLEAVVVPSRPADRGPLYAALAELAEQDPLIGLRRDELREEIAVSLYGEIQKEILEATLHQDFGIKVSFQETTTVYIERPRGTGSAAEFMGGDGNPFRATVGLRVEPGPVGSAVRFRLGIELGSLPLAFIKAVEESVRATLRHGLHGWEVTDCVVTLTHSGYTPPPPYGWSKSSSSAGDFRNLAPLVLLAALRQAGTNVHEPIHRVHVEVPGDVLSAVMPVVARLGGIVQASRLRGASAELEADVPATRVHELQQLLPSLSRGEGVLDSTFDHYRQVRGPVPARPGWHPSAATSGRGRRG
ncbi:elongation factor G [Allorhizocola rhizosphaerae]|uniref:elongation factor G n=1 Tax=Allorhizocola rhizosphaerae TaxID=1872709 RepID=UPI000E3CF5B4|nr:TetM/TetW/TetO/TetS family tetracycline resistance ribosomal protection protein [Allorhizocola rhizosphaerae]